MLENRRFYVYELLSITGVPFYVGKGCGNRWKAHEKKLDGYNLLKNAYIEQCLIILGEVPKIKVREGLTEKRGF